MPESREDDHYQREKAKIPDYIRHQTKAHKALLMVEDFKKYEEDLPLTAPVIGKLVASTIISRWESFDSTIDLCIQQPAGYHSQIKQNLKQDYLT